MYEYNCDNSDAEVEEHSTNSGGLLLVKWSRGPVWSKAHAETERKKNLGSIQRMTLMEVIMGMVMKRA